MRVSTNAILGFAGTVLLVICAAAFVGRSSFGPQPQGLRLIDASGALSISNDREGHAVLSASGLVPGRSVTGTVTVDAGSSALTLSETAPVDAPGPRGGRLSDRLALRVDDVTTPAAPRLLYSGPLAGLPSTALGAGLGARTYRFTVTFSDSGPGDVNRFMASSTSIGFLWDATAADEPGAGSSYADQVAFDAPIWTLAAGDAAFANTVLTGVDGVAGDHTAAWFDGVSGYAYVNGLDAPRRAYTIEAWVRPDGTANGTIADQGGAGALLLRGGRPAFRQTDTEISSAAALTPGTWHHVAGTWDGRTARLYVDGAEVASGTATTAPSGTATLYIGYGQSAPWFAGTIDGVAYYATALPAARIAAHFGAVTVPAAAPAATPAPGSSAAPAASTPPKVVAQGKPQAKPKPKPKPKPKHKAKPKHKKPKHKAKKKPRPKKPRPPR